MTVTNKDLFYCYNIDLVNYLVNEKKITPLTAAITINTKRPFTLFARSYFLSICIEEYKTTKTLSNHK